MQREKLEERGREAGRRPPAAGGESRRSLLCSGGAGTGCARFCGPGKCGGGVGGSRCGARQRLAAGRCRGAGAWWGLRRAGAGACGGQVQGLAAGRCRGRGGPQAAPAQPGPAGFARRNRPPDGLTCGPLYDLPPAKNPPTAVGGFRYLFRDYSSAGASSSTGSSSGASSASSALMDRLAR